MSLTSRNPILVSTSRLCRLREWLKIKGLQEDISELIFRTCVVILNFFAVCATINGMVRISLGLVDSTLL
jgi:hypothetical protein